MEYTKNYHLPQWEKSDRVMMEDFNAAMANLEIGLGEAKAAAEQAQSAAEQMPFVIGTYVGNIKSKYFRLGFRPSFLIISRSFISNDPKDSYGMTSCYTENNAEHTVQFDDQGFTLLGDVMDYPSLNWNKCNYCYIAFR